jgi:geranylgeranyl pyrophosphate synthase/uncharacterized protein with NAD-binding domain and iron-sulfur cluster
MTRVIVLGGGVAGMTAAHELIDRGFEVVVLERRDLAGGKARSVPVGDDGAGRGGHELAANSTAPIGHQLPGEHGFRFFPGFYKHVIDTMRRIPADGGGGEATVADHLVQTTRVAITQYGKPTFVVPAVHPRAPGDAGAILRDILLAFSPVTDLTPDDVAFFGARIWQILTSCPQRRLAEYEGIDWWDFVGAQERSVAYRKFLADGITRSLVAAKARKASTRTIGDIFVQLMLTIANPAAASTDRVLDGPTNQVWIDPWLALLEARGVRYQRNVEVERILVQGGRVRGVVVCGPDGSSRVEGDHYIAALPIERIAPLVDADLRAADPKLGNLARLAPNVAWMSGIQYYLRSEVPDHPGHVIHIDTPWALTSISQLRFWRGVDPAKYAAAGIHTVLSVDVSDWTAPDDQGRAAIRCSREEVVHEVWQQLKRSVNVEREVLRDADLHSWFLDADIDVDPHRPGWLANAEPLLVNLVDTWALRPEATTAIANLFLASDYVRTHTDLATMEGANEAARRAVNCLLDAEGFAGARCEIWPLHEPEPFAAWRAYDATRLAAGLPWDDATLQVAAHALRAAGPTLDQVAPLLAAAAPYLTPVADGLQAAGDAGPPVPEAAPAGGDLIGPGGFLERLGWYRELLADTLEAGVPGWEPQRHLYALVRDFVARSGKGLRPALCIATARALGGRTADALPAAAGIEMLHNAFLVHDDIEDASDLRRGVATMHRHAGVPLAVNTGDAMNALAMRLLRSGGERLGPAAALRVMDEVDHMLVETLEGQATELGWVRDNDPAVGADDYLRLVLKKTAWYSFIHPLRIGALVADGADPDLDRFDRFGYLLGLAFQVTDDLLNLNGSAQRYGKEINGDLWEGKRTLMLTHAFAHADRADRGWIRDFLGRPRERRLPREVLRLRGILERNGSIAQAQHAACAFAQAAASEFESAFASAAQGPDLDWLRASVEYLVRRDL